jgi:ketosteroid isomerase-like protein
MKKHLILPLVVMILAGALFSQTGESPEQEAEKLKIARCGEVAWFFCILDDINTYKGEPASWENARWTGVVEKRDGRWVVVQQHFSFASDR